MGEGKLSNAEENEVDYYKGIAYQKLGNDAESTKYLMKATQGSTEPQQAFYYNDQQPDKIFYQGLAWRALGEENKARSRFNKLIDHGKSTSSMTVKLITSQYHCRSLPYGKTI